MFLIFITSQKRNVGQGFSLAFVLGKQTLRFALQVTGENIFLKILNFPCILQNTVIKIIAYVSASLFQFTE